jgi:hypothetical protein
MFFTLSLEDASHHAVQLSIAVSCC